MIPFLDMKAVYAELKPELDAAYARVMESGWFVLGKEVEAFEAEYAAFCGTAHCVGLANGLEALELALRAWDLGARALRTPKPSAPEDIPDWTKQMAYAQDALDYSEYALANLASKQTDDLKRAELVLALQERNPQSKFLAIAKKPTVIELASLNPQKAIQLAEEGLVKLLGRDQRASEAELAEAHKLLEQQILKKKAAVEEEAPSSEGAP